MRFLIALISLISYTTIKAQDYKGEVWGAYINTISLSDTWKIWNDYHYVTNGFSIIRPGITYQTPKGYQFTAGYAFVLASTSNTNQLIRQENRIWGQAIKKIHLHPKLQYIIRFRYDARFRQSLDSQGEIIENQRTFNNRFRLMQDLRYRLATGKQQNFWHIDIINETLLNTWKSITNSIDQVRSYLLIGYTVPNLTVLAGYHQRFVPRKANNWTLIQGLTVWLIHNIDFHRIKKAN
ncbi:MAG: DUF2490 domain-containing protein [Saprospiraceae bacterium]|nr:DUF2490 domain-containing protein [Saprospiraceae bacterium]